MEHGYLSTDLRLKYAKRRIAIEFAASWLVQSRQSAQILQPNIHTHNHTERFFTEGSNVVRAKSLLSKDLKSLKAAPAYADDVPSTASSPRLPTCGRLSEHRQQ